MGFLTKEGLQNLTNKLVQGDAIKVASHRGKNVKEVIDNIQRECENVALPNTMTKENRVSEFKVGKGRDVDVSGDVEEGKVEVELKGKTWQNLYNKYSIYTLPYELADVNTLKQRVFTFNFPLLKPNTKYTYIFNFSNVVSPVTSLISIKLDGEDVRPSELFYGYCNLHTGITSKVVGVNSRSSITGGLNQIRIAQSYVEKGVEGTLESLIILEGDYTQTPVEELPKYFEGIKSSFEDGIVDVEVQGKNLISKATEWRLGVINADTGIYSDKPSGTRYTSNLIYNPSGKELYIRSKGHMWNYLYFYDENKNYLGFCTNQGMGSNYNFNINFDNSKRIAKYFIISFGNQDALEIGEVYEYRETDYITPYKKKISFNIEESLRSLPNGVCDEIRNNNGQ